MTISSSSVAVRQHCADLKAEDLDNKPLRNVDPKTGALEIYSSTDALMRWVPKFGWDLLGHWCKMPIFRVRLFRSRLAFEQGGIDRGYTEQVFVEGEDLLAAVVWWRRRVREEGKGFAIFEGGFDTTGLIYLTDPPRCFIDAESGEVEADNAEELERKRALHVKRRDMESRWAKKGVPEELRQKIEHAEVSIQERKRRGDEYALRGGWIPSVPASAAGADISQAALDVAKHNEYQKKYGLQ